MEGLWTICSIILYIFVSSRGHLHYWSVQDFGWSRLQVHFLYPFLLFVSLYLDFVCLPSFNDLHFTFIFNHSDLEFHRYHFGPLAFSLQVLTLNLEKAQVSSLTQLLCLYYESSTETCLISDWEMWRWELKQICVSFWAFTIFTFTRSKLLPFIIILY